MSVFGDSSRRLGALGTSRPAAIVLAISAGVILLLGGRAVQGDETIVARIGFEETLADVEIVELLGESPDVQVQATLIWTSGLTSTYRNYTEELESPSDFLRMARAKSEESFRKGFTRSKVPIKDFLEKHTLQHLENDPELVTRARSYVNIREQLHRGLLDAEQGEPLIYGLEVSGPESQIDDIGSSQLVRVVHVKGDIMQITQSVEDIKPQAYRDHVIFPEVAEMDTEKLYERMQSVVTHDSGSEEIQRR